MLIASSAHVLPLKSKVGQRKPKASPEFAEHAAEILQPLADLNAKSRINDDLTIPKLELEAIRLLSDLYSVHRRNFDKTMSFTAYTDSSIALSWIRNRNCIDNRYVQKKVNKVRQVIKPGQIHHVRTDENPADLPSRGVNASQLVDCKLWFQGPPWMTTEKLPSSPYRDLQQTLANTTVQEPVGGEFIETFSDWRRLQRATANALRWRSNAHSNKEDKVRGALKVDELELAKKKLIQLQQRRQYGKEITLLENGKLPPKKHILATLNAYLDPEDGYLRVGGRLHRAELSHGANHPILLGKGHLSDLLIKLMHNDYGHAGNQQTERLIQESFHIPALKQSVKRVTRQCLICARWKGLVNQPMMSDLPKERICQQPNFNAISVDLAGPFMVKASRIRSDRPIKVWVAIFVCQLSKAVQLEACLDLSTEEFLCAFTRFISRRGQPTHVLSDNQTSFVLADKLLQDAWNKIQRDCQDKMALQSIRWVFSPPRSPSFNGLAEAMVKLFKYFLRRMGNIETLRYDEFLTILCRVEGQINMRPLSANPAEPGRPTALTPFLLTQQRLMKPFILDSHLQKPNPLTNRYNNMISLQKELWARFETEYIRQLQCATSGNNRRELSNLEMSSLSRI